MFAETRAGSWSKRFLTFDRFTISLHVARSPKRDRTLRANARSTIRKVQDECTENNGPETRFLSFPTFQNLETRIALVKPRFKQREGLSKIFYSTHLQMR